MKQTVYRMVAQVNGNRMRVAPSFSLSFLNGVVVVVVVCQIGMHLAKVSEARTRNFVVVFVVGQNECNGKIKSRKINIVKHE